MRHPASVVNAVAGPCAFSSSCCGRARLCAASHVAAAGAAVEPAWQQLFRPRAFALLAHVAAAALAGPGGGDRPSLVPARSRPCCGMQQSRAGSVGHWRQYGTSAGSVCWRCDGVGRSSVWAAAAAQCGASGHAEAGSTPVGNAIDVWGLCLRVIFSPPEWWLAVSWCLWCAVVC